MKIMQRFFGVIIIIVGLITDRPPDTDDRAISLSTISAAACFHMGCKWIMGKRDAELVRRLQSPHAHSPAT